MSCGQLALARAGISIDKYYASEIDKHAITVAKNNHPSTLHLGDVNEWREWDIDWKAIDLLIGGSPCQGFSLAGKQLNFDDPRSKLFFVFVDILNHIKTLNPDVRFLLENVKMKQEYLDVISKHLTVKPIFINSRLLSAQNRQRYYWCNWDVEQPQDAQITLEDILEETDESLTREGYRVVGGAMRGRYLVNNVRQDSKMLTAGMTKQYIETRRDCKTNALTTVTKDNKVVFLKDLSKTRHEVAETHFRDLTPVECERLQTVPDNYTSSVSKTQRLRMLGNGWTVSVITHIFNHL